MIQKILKEKKGSAFIYVVTAAFVAVTICGILVSMFTYEIRINRITEERIKTKYLAEAGIEHAMLCSGTAGSDIIIDGEGNTLYEYLYSVSGGTINITSYGYLNNERKIKIDCIVRDDLIKEWNESSLN